VCIDVPKPRSPRYARVECTLASAELWMRIIVVLRRSRINSRRFYIHVCGRALQLAGSLQESRHKTTVTTHVWISGDVPVKVTRQKVFSYHCTIITILYYPILSQNTFQVDMYTLFLSEKIIVDAKPSTINSLLSFFNRRHRGVDEFCWLLIPY